MKWLVFLLILVIQTNVMTLADRSDKFLEKDSDKKYKLEWIGEPEIIVEEGKTHTVSASLDSGDHESEITVTKEVSLTYEWKKGIELETKAAGLIKAKVGVGLSNSHSNKTSLSHKIPIDKHSVGVVKFRENIIIVRGRVRITYLYEWTDCVSNVFVLVFIKNHCYREPEEHDIELKQTEVDELGNPVGRFWMEYTGTDKYKHPAFYNLVNKTADFSDGLPIEELVKSAYECGQRAIELGQYLALYIVKEMKCLVKKVDVDNGNTCDRYGYEIGSFNIPGPHKAKCKERDTKVGWINTKNCDVIHDGKDGIYYCKDFAYEPGSVLMIRRASPHARYVLAPAQNETEKQSADDTATPVEDTHVTQVNHPHPKFYHLTKKDFPISIHAIKAPHIKSAYECGDLAITNERFMAIFNPRDGLCYIEEVNWSHGRSFDSQGRLLGPYDLRLNKINHTTSSSERENWISEGKCDLIHNSIDGTHTCEKFDPSDQGLIIMLRYNDAYETYKIYKGFQEKENQRLIFSEARHVKFYSLKDKTYKLELAVEQKKDVEWAYECGQLGVVRSKYVVVYSHSTKICSFFNVTLKTGNLLDRWGKRIGTYDLPGYDKEHTTSIKVLESWQNPYQCDVIFTANNRVHLCKDFPHEEGSVLMFRKE